MHNEVKLMQIMQIAVGIAIGVLLSQLYKFSTPKKYPKITKKLTLKTIVDKTNMDVWMK